MQTTNTDIKGIIKEIIIPFIIMLAIWFCNELILDPFFIANLSSLNVEIITSAIKLIIWCGFALILIKRFKDSLYISLSEMFKNKFDFKLFLYIFAFFTIYILIGAYSNNHRIGIAEDLKIYSLLNRFVIVGITEELFFRGFLLNASLTKIKNPNIAIGLNSILFLIIHFPIWIQHGIFISNFTSFAFLTIIILNIIFCYCFIKGKNILIPIFLHMYWDLLVTVINV